MIQSLSGSARGVAERRGAGLRGWPVRPPLGGVRESDGGQVLVGGVPVDAVAPCIGVDGDGGAGGDPGPGGLTAGRPANPVPARLHAGTIRAAWRSRSRLRHQTPATRRPAIGRHNCRIAGLVWLYICALDWILSQYQGPPDLPCRSFQRAERLFVAFTVFCSGQSARVNLSARSQVEKSRSSPPALN
jgi:hypothetical protein